MGEEREPIDLGERKVPTALELLANVFPFWGGSSKARKFEPRATDLSPVKPRQRHWFEIKLDKDKKEGDKDKKIE